MPDGRWRRSGLAIGIGVILALLLLTGTAVAAGLVWTKPQDISTDSGYAVDTVQMVLDGNELLHAVWVAKDNTDGSYNIFHAYAQQTAGGVWSWITPTRVLPAQSPPAALAVDSNNRLHIAYPNVGQSGMRYLRRDSNGVWGDQKPVYSPSGYTLSTDGTVNQPTIGIYEGSGTTTVHIVWAEIGDTPPRSSNFQIVHAFSIDGGTTWTQAQTTEVYSSTAFSNYPDMVIDQSGKLHVVWEEGSAGTKIYYSVGTPGSGTVTWLSPTIISGSLTNCHRSSIALAGNQLLVAWGRAPEGATQNQDVYYSTKQLSGGSWLSPTMLLDSRVSLQNIKPFFTSPRIVAANTGRVVIVWDGYKTGGTEDIYFSETMDISDPSAWTEPVNVSSNSTRSYSPRAVLDSKGTVHIVWVDDIDVLYAHSKYGVFLPLVLRNR
ncbi:MAG: hypothetical protein NUW24_03410 [Anaerolineae bacterium]|nr:hypothetical protein [Anaerolineae bacterium]MDH7473544.1 hypothetical protein [Anaerolineae bacterium]